MAELVSAACGSERAAWRGVGARVGTRQFSIDLDTARAERDGQPMTVRLADSDDQRSAANMLLNRMYSWRGYGTHHQLPRRESSASFVASVADRMIGTLTLTADSEEGLCLDKTFGDELAQFRSTPGARICELTKLAFDTSGTSLPYLAALFHIIFIYGTHRFDCSDLFIEVNPRHARFYESMLLFRRVGDAKTNQSVSAPAQLMWLKVSEVRRLIDEHARKDGRKSRSLYSHFFSAREEKGICERLMSSAWDPLGREAVPPAGPQPLWG